MENMSISETLKKVQKYYPARPFMTTDVIGLYGDDGYDTTDTRVINTVSRHLTTLHKQRYLKVVEKIRTGGNKYIYMVKQ